MTRALFGEVHHTEEYRSALSSKYWKDLKREVIRCRGRKCERCGAPYFVENLQLHHKHYQNIGNETQSDVELLCKNCHADADLERMTRTQSKNEDALYQARLDGWASKVYGEDWQYYDDAGDVEEHFNDWLESQ
jgi:5-methylcytosine-specific restriction endonuclease McrA